MTKRFGVLALSLVGTATMAATFAAQPVPPIEGLWSYQAIAPSGQSEVPIQGFIVFHAGRFVQQTLNVGEPYEKQVAQAHAGTYRVDGRHLRLMADVGFVVTPTNSPPVDARHRSTHELTVAQSEETLTLTFNTGTVQKLTRAGPGNGRVYPLREGALALVDGRFVLVADVGRRAIAGSGSFERVRETLTLHPNRWFSLRDDIPVYAREPIVATFDEQTLRIPGEPVLSVRK